MAPDEQKDARFWIAGILGEAFASHPILTIMLIAAFLGGAVLGAQQGLAMAGFLGLVIGSLAGALCGVLLVGILWLILIGIGLAG